MKFEASYLQYFSKFVSQIVKSIQYVGEIVRALPRQTYTVIVKNDNEQLLREVAYNTRGVKGKLEELIVKPTGSEEIEHIVKEIALAQKNQTINVKTDQIIKTQVQNYPTSMRIDNLHEFPAPQPISIPKIDTTRLELSIEGMKALISQMTGAIQKIKPEKVIIPPFPKPEKFPTALSLKEAETIVDALQGVRDDLALVHKAITEKESVELGKVEVTNFPPQLSHGATVTDVNINALRGFAKTTAVSVGTSVTALPSTPLQYRKAIILYNNSSNTIYLGGSDVTTSNGLPVAAGSYSSPIDAGMYMKVYAVAASGSNDVRVLEVSSQREGA